MDFRKLSGLDSRIVSGKLWRKNFKAASNTKYEDFVLLDNGMNKR